MRAYLAITLLLLSGCSTVPPVATPPWVGRFDNACLPEAIVMTKGLQDSGVRAKVLRIKTAKWGHAVCVYLYPSAQNRLWVWDSYWKSLNLNAWYSDPSSVARSWLRYTCQEPLVSAEYIQ